MAIVLKILFLMDAFPSKTLMMSAGHEKRHTGERLDNRPLVSKDREDRHRKHGLPFASNGRQKRLLV